MLLSWELSPSESSFLLLPNSSSASHFLFSRRAQGSFLPSFEASEGGSVSSSKQASQPASMSGLFHHGQAEEGQQKKGWFGGGGSSSSSDEEKEGGHRHTAAGAEGGRRRLGRASKKAVKLVSKANTNYSVTVKNDQAVLSPDNANADERQVWIRDESWGNKVQDDGGNPAFALVNKATGLALQHARHEGEPVRLAPYDPDTLDDSLLWTVSEDLGDGFRAVRKASDTSLNLDAWKADPDSGGVHDGTILTLYKWNKGPNQLWKFDILY